ncbi:hypothetical protein ACF1GT_17730 [Streptomyces sp. NPDC014636]|uniref:hypothetical protein n=1 Tax=Streptomyces sp. NPDC014636 TaxID=3364876 RepID=UPI00370133F9
MSPWFGHVPLGPARLAGYDGTVFVKDVPGRRPRLSVALAEPTPDGGTGGLEVS